MNKKDREKENNNSRALMLTIACIIILGGTITPFLIVRHLLTHETAKPDDALEFSLEEIDFSRIRENDFEYAVAIASNAVRSATVRSLKITLREKEEQMVVTEIAINYLESIYDALPQNFDTWSRDRILTMIEVQKSNLEELKESYNETLKTLDVMNE